MIQPDIVGEHHWNRYKFEVKPFCVGDVEPGGSFVHVFDDGSLDFVLSELDTITDFTSYLTKKADFVRSGRLLVAHGEEDLVAYYAVRVNEDGDHDFTHPENRAWSEGESIAISETATSLVRNPQYLAKKQADQISYVWDALIEQFTTHLLGGTSIVLDGYDFDLQKSEESVRYMALESRLQRRSHGQAIVGALQISEKTGRMFFRSMIPVEGTRNDEVGFFILVFPYLDWMEELGGYDHYRLKRMEAAELYAQAMLLRSRHLKRIVGVATEPPGQGRGSSEEMVHVKAVEWTQDQIAEIQDACARLGIAQNIIEREVEGDEYPALDRAASVESPPPHLNRKARRAWLAARRKG